MSTMNASLLRLFCSLALLLLAGCGSLPREGASSGVAGLLPRSPASEAVLQQENDVVLFALGLVDTGYRFGGKNPSAGFDCSGMVSYIFQNAAGVQITGSAADMAQRGKPVDVRELRPGDLVFFNTQNRPFSHVGLYIGDGRFVHAPSGGGRARVRTESLKTPYFASRLEAARSLLE